MPNGVICGGACDGSNQAGEIVTCHAMTIFPAGAASAASTAGARSRAGAASSEPTIVRREGRNSTGVMFRVLPLLLVVPAGILIAPHLEQRRRGASSAPQVRDDTP